MFKFTISFMKIAVFSLYYEFCNITHISILCCSFMKKTDKWHCLLKCYKVIYTVCILASIPEGQAEVFFTSKSVSNVSNMYITFIVEMLQILPHNPEVLDLFRIAIFRASLDREFYTLERKALHSVTKEAFWLRQGFTDICFTWF